MSLEGDFEEFDEFSSTLALCDKIAVYTVASERKFVRLNPCLVSVSA